MARDTGIADRLRSKGLTVVEVAGWQTRGSSYFNPRGSVDHHTAGAARGNAPSLRICTHGRAGLPGPLCNVLVGRDNTCFVVAAGRANHAGRGGWSGLSGNSSVYGVERENVGTPAEPWRDDQHLVAGVVHAALIEGRADASKVCEHKEWTTRKIDAHSISGDDMRRLVGAVLGANPSPPPPPTVPTPPPPAPAPDINWAEVRKMVAAVLLPSVQDLPDLDGNSRGLRVIVLQRALNLVTGSKLKEDGIYGPATIQAVLNFQNFVNKVQPGVIQDFPGAAHRYTRFFLIESLKKIMAGEA